MKEKVTNLNQDLTGYGFHRYSTVGEESPEKLPADNGE